MLNARRTPPYSSPQPRPTAERRDYRAARLIVSRRSRSIHIVVWLNSAAIVDDADQLDAVRGRHIADPNRSGKSRRGGGPARPRLRSLMKIAAPARDTADTLPLAHRDSTRSLNAARSGRE